MAGNFDHTVADPPGLHLRNWNCLYLFCFFHRNIQVIAKFEWSCHQVQGIFRRPSIRGRSYYQENETGYVRIY